MNQEQKLEQFAEREFKRNLDKIIVDDTEGGFLVFGKYRLLSDSHGVKVSTYDQDVHTFTNKRTATAWCTADRYRRYAMANNIVALDRKRQTLAADIHCRKLVGERGSTETFYEIVGTKLQPKIDQLNSVTSELEKCIISAKYMQIRGFNNETA